MAHTIEIPDDVYAELVEYARKCQQAPEALIVAWARELTKPANQGLWGTQNAPTAEELRANPLLGIAGSLSIGDPRLATECDTVLGEAVADDHGNED